MRALKAGKHVLVEKPIADTADEAREMISSAEEKGLVLLEAIHYTWVASLSCLPDDFSPMIY
jgi:predicted dehydrogenase